MKQKICNLKMTGSGRVNSMYTGTAYPKKAPLKTLATTLKEYPSPDRESSATHDGQKGLGESH